MGDSIVEDIHVGQRVADMQSKCNELN